MGSRLEAVAEEQQTIQEKVGNIITILTVLQHTDIFVLFFRPIHNYIYH